MATRGGGQERAAERQPAVAGSFYPADAADLATLVDGLLEDARRAAVRSGTAALPDIQGILVPHAGLVYSGLTAAAGWRVLPRAPGEAAGTIVILGTNHRAAWLNGVGVWDAGSWRTPLGSSTVDEELAGAIDGMGAPFAVDRRAHQGEHSIEVQLPIVKRLSPEARIVPLSVATGTGAGAIAAGRRLGALLAERRARGDRIQLAISSDMAHYPPARLAELVTEALAPSIEALDAVALAEAEATIRSAGVAGVACGMCGIEPAVVGLAALRTMGATKGRVILASNSADAGGDASRTVGYLSVAFST